MFKRGDAVRISNSRMVPYHGQVGTVVELDRGRINMIIVRVDGEDGPVHETYFVGELEKTND